MLHNKDQMKILQTKQSKNSFKNYLQLLQLFFVAWIEVDGWLHLSFERMLAR